jgi:hypothetical protein
VRGSNPPQSIWFSMPGAGAVMALTAGLVLAGCGGGGAPAPRAARGATFPAGPTIPIQVTRATFPASQRLAEHTRLVIAVRNAGTRPLPDVAVTITNPAYGTGVAPFATYMEGSGLASHSRPVWIVDQPPGPCRFSCAAGGAGGAPSADTNTWALGRLAPGATAVFRWGVTAVAPGTYRVSYRVAAGLQGMGAGRALLPDGAAAFGTFTVRIAAAPVASYITPSGKITTTP